MQVQQIVQASAEVITIARLSPGDVYKRVETDYSGNATLRYGIVQSVMNNGSDAAVSAVEFKPEYGGVTVTEKIITAGSEAALFPATPVEVEAHFVDLTDALTKDVEAKQNALRESLRKQALVEAVIADHPALTAPQVTLANGVTALPIRE